MNKHMIQEINHHNHQMCICEMNTHTLPNPIIQYIIYTISKHKKKRILTMCHATQCEFISYFSIANMTNGTNEFRRRRLKLINYQLRVSIVAGDMVVMIYYHSKGGKHDPWD